MNHKPRRFGRDAAAFGFAAVFALAACGTAFAASGTTTLEGSKFYDYDADGVWDTGVGDNEPGVADVRINVFINDAIDGWVLFDPSNQGFTTTTDGSGDWSVSDVPSGALVKVCEVLPETGTSSMWVQTAPAINTEGERCYITTTTVFGLTGLDFGNVCAFEIGCGRTQGFWRNKHGKRIIEAKDDSLRPAEDFFTKWVNPLCLYWEDGSELEFSGNFNADYQLLKKFLHDSRAKNMSYMLSVQFLVTKLNFQLHQWCSQEETNSLRLLLTDVEGAAECWSYYKKWGNYTPVAGFTEITSWANQLLCGHTGGNLILPGDPFRGHFECAKDLLDAFNNNGFRALHDQPCDVIYPPINP